MFKLAAAAFFLVGGSAFAQSVTSTPGALLDPLDCKLFTAATASANHNSDDVGATTLSAPIDARNYKNLAVQLKWSGLTGTIDATLKVQVATVPAQPVSADWVDKSTAVFTLAGASGANAISVSNLTERWARVVYTAVDVTGGTITGYCEAKQ